MHTDAIPVFEGAEKKAWLANRQLTRLAALEKAAKSDKGAGSAGESEVRKYYADAYGDAGYASKMDDAYGTTGGYKLSDGIGERAKARRKAAGIEVPFVKFAADGEEECEDCCEECGKCGNECECDNVDKTAATADTNEQISKAEQDLVALKQKAAAEAAAEAAKAGTVKTQSSTLQMRKEARRKIVAQAYGEPVKEDYGDVGAPDWDASKLTRNAIVDSPQPDIIKQLDNAIKNVREAMSK